MLSIDDLVRGELNNMVDKIDFTGAESVHHGKVRESFVFNNQARAIVVTDRVSAFDFVLGKVPFKGRVLNQIAAWWFKKLDAIDIPHHIISVPGANVSLVKSVTPLPVEIIVRGYLTGSTKTSSWYAYQYLDRQICGLEMPVGMKKDEKFPEHLVTPTTKPELGHDEGISKEDIIARGLVSVENWEKVEEYALKMFKFGQEEAAKRGMILVDTKYEMGITADGEVIVIDEVHTPDSSRYWIADTYKERMAAGKAPESLDKEFVRGMVVKNGFDVESDEDPAKYFTEDIQIAAAKKYLALYRKMTGEDLELNSDESIVDILENLPK